MKRNKCLIIMLSFSLISTGCWDQHLMKNVTLIQALTYDLTNKQLLCVGAAAPVIGNLHSKNSSSKSDILVTTARTPGEAKIILNHMASGVLDTAKNKLLLLGEAFAAQDIYPFLDLHYRNPRNSLNARVAVVKDKALPLIQLKNDREEHISRYLLDLIQSAEESLIIPEENIQSIASVLLDPGEDITLPFIVVEENKHKAFVKGIALFNDRKYTGYHLNHNQSTLYLLLKKGSPQQNSFIITLDNVTKNYPERFVSFTVKHIKRKIKLHKSTHNQIYVSIDMNLKLQITEYPKGDVENDSSILKEKLSAALTTLTEEVLSHLKESNCDALGIGRKLMAFQPEVWSQLNKEDYFKKVHFKTSITIDGIKSGIVK
ncbi:Ger(x)C family spore germination protein [Paenibacillus profundus]|nr:Ger(x)C family spore germination protein [Paenibacillus profundus]